MLLNLKVLTNMLSIQILILNEESIRDTNLYCFCLSQLRTVFRFGFSEKRQAKLINHSFVILLMKDKSRNIFALLQYDFCSMLNGFAV